MAALGHICHSGILPSRIDSHLSFWKPTAVPNPVLLFMIFALAFAGKMLGIPCNATAALENLTTVTMQSNMFLLHHQAELLRLA